MTGFEYHDNYVDHTVCEFTPEELKEWMDDDSSYGQGYAYYYEVVGPVQQYVAPVNIDYTTPETSPFAGLRDLLEAA